jgi:hypothetical protein
VEIDNRTAMRWGMAGPIPITVYAAESSAVRKTSAVYFSSEMIPLDERHSIPPEGYGYQASDVGGATEKRGSASQMHSNILADSPYDKYWID